jgi:ATPase family AAA domain-containing protein 3A/B
MQLNRKLFPQKDDSLIVLAPKLKNQMQRIANSTKNIKKNNGYYQHMLLYGSPGTGKTMYCKQLATNSGMDYAIMSGANFDRFNSQESQIQLANLFKWAQRSKKGLLIFIDEADAFLESRQSNNISERTRKLISSFLAHTGTETKNFQIALATNHPENLDTAVLDRTDHKIEFSLPGYRERYKLLQTYWLKHIECPLSKNETSFKEWLFGPENNRPMDSEYQFNNRDISSIAAKTEGFSGRGISKLMLSIRSAGWAYDMPITKELIDTIVTEKVSEKEQVNDFNK